MINAAANTVRSIEPVFTLQKGLQARLSLEKRIVFCEECGTRQSIDGDRYLFMREISCRNCGDTIEIGNHLKKFRRNNFISILAGGPGCFRNLLGIVSRLDADMGGALIVVIMDEDEAVNSFTEYLNSISTMRVVRARENMRIDGGNCYIVSGTESFGLKPYSANVSFQQLSSDDGKDPLDLLLSSTATVFRNRTAAVILSGDAHGGVAGVQAILEAQGTALMLDPAECYYKGLGTMIRDSCPSIISLGENDLVAQIQALHYGSKTTVTAV
ncbi:chemotaxis response regulator CheB [Desulfoprunum benzoelyticum]|uniref:protein-glutamate methylesterase n=1 Tax=Desulfoprunum benzoelyticum TaxID=1506996 RepID=A0A840UST9_9BACT|nr:chemotaxis response regulator CheB [Desulfoprunum benzoelyticum]